MKRRELRTLDEYGVAGGRAIGSRSIAPVTFAMVGTLSKKQQERLDRALESRARTREYLKNLAQEGLPERRPLKTIQLS